MLLCLIGTLLSPLLALGLLRACLPLLLAFVAGFATLLARLAILSRLTVAARVLTMAFLVLALAFMAWAIAVAPVAVTIAVAVTAVTAFGTITTPVARAAVLWHFLGCLDGTACAAEEESPELHEDADLLDRLCRSRHRSSGLEGNAGRCGDARQRSGYDSR